MSFGSFLLLIFVLAIWTLLAVYSLPAGLGYNQARRRDAENLRKTENSLRNAGNQRQRDALRSSVTRHRQARSGNLAAAILHFALCGLFFILGLAMLGAVLPAWKILALLAGMLCFGGCVWLGRRLGARRRQWRTNPPPGRQAHGGHGPEAFGHLLGMVALIVIGIFLLIAVF